jgi:ribosomal protein S18 acetylase RimI-like enzyme
MISYRDFVPEHVDGVMAICRAEGWPSYIEDPGLTARALTAPGIKSVVALDEGTVAGFATAGGDGAIQAYLILIGVQEGYRHRGIGTRLVEEVHRRTGARRMDLLSTEGADKFYETFPYARKLPGYRIYPGAAQPSADV